MSDTRTPTTSRRQALTAVAATGLGLPLLAACSSDEGATGTDGAEGAAAAPAPDAPLAAVADVPEGGGLIVEEARVVITQPTAGEFKAFSAVCPHQGCLVSEVTETINCRCHSSSFSLEDGSVLGGPAGSPLSSVDVVVEGDQIVAG